MIWVHGKEREEYTPVLPETAQRLMDMAEGLEASDHVFRGRTRELGESGMANMINRLFSRAGLTEYQGHDLRRTFATVVREHSKDEFLAMRLLRDQVPILNSRYVTISESTLREALELYSPLRLIDKDSPSILGEKPPKLAGEIMLETGETMVETGESRTPRPEEAAQNILQA
jgi:integrase